MAPEQAEGRTRDVGPSVDIYALGAVLYEMLTGEPPHQGETLMATLENVRFREPVPPSELRPGTPRDLEVICLKCLSKEPADRYPSADALVQDLQRFVDGEPISARRLSFFEQLRRAVRHFSADASFRALSVAMLAIAPVPFLCHLGVFLLFRHHDRFAAIAVTLSTTLMFVMPAIIIWVHRPALRQVSTQQRRIWWTTWAAHLPAMLLIPAVCVFAGVPNLMIVYPLWMIAAAMTFMSLAAVAGFLSLTATLLFGLALLLTQMLYYAPLVLGSIMSANMLVQGIVFVRTGKREREEKERDGART
jgi:hypothetical protein